MMYFLNIVLYNLIDFFLSMCSKNIFNYSSSNKLHGIIFLNINIYHRFLTARKKDIIRYITIVETESKITKLFDF